MTRIAIMQPYFLPYPGYFRLMVGVDAFVIGDIQQFPRRGWVHRNRLRDDAGELAWLTLPLRHQPLDTPISDISLADNAKTILRQSMQRFAACRRPNSSTESILAQIRSLPGHPLELIVSLLKDSASRLNFAPPILFQSNLDVPGALVGAEHVYAICEALGAKEYVNPPNGRALYDASEFRKRGLKLLFLSDYEGDRSSILQRFSESSTDAIRAEILANVRYEED